MYDDVEFAKREFELIEYQTIDIDSIEEIEISKKEKEQYTSFIIKIGEKTNELVRMLKYLNKEIQSIKEK